MRNLRVIGIVSLIVWVFAANSASAQRLRGIPATQDDSSPRVRGTLFPGESYTFKDVTLSWIVGERRGTPPWGYTLKLQGPRSVFESLPLLISSPTVAWERGKGRIDHPTGKSTEPRDTFVFLDGVYLHLTAAIEVFRDSANSSTEYTPPSSITYEFTAQPDPIPISGKGVNRDFYFSSMTPAHIGDLELKLSDAPVKLPSGSQFFQATITNPKTGEAVTLPMQQGATRVVGDNLELRVVYVYDATRTVQVHAEKQFDLSIKGGDTYIATPPSVVSNETYGDLFTNLGGVYGFDVEWVANPKDAKDSIEYAKNLKIPWGSQWDTSIFSGSLREILGAVLLAHEKRVPLSAIGTEWTDAQHVRVWAKRYEEFALQKHAEQDQAGQIEKTFKEQYASEIRIYKLANITPTTAKALIDPELKTYLLLNRPPGVGFSSGGGIELLQSGSLRAIVSTESFIKDPLHFMGGEMGVSSLGATQESAIADEKANALIVTAAPKTHEKIAEILKRTDGMLKSADASGAVEHFPIEVSLLRGIKEQAVAANDLIELKFAHDVSAPVAEILAMPGTKVKKGDPIARLDTARVELEVKQYESAVEVQRKSHEIQQKNLQQLVDAGAGPTARNEAELKLVQMDGEMAKYEAGLEQARRWLDQYTLKAPWYGRVESLRLTANSNVQGGETVGFLKIENNAAQTNLDPGTEHLRRELMMLKAKELELSKRFKEDNPELRKIREEIRELESLFTNEPSAKPSSEEDPSVPGISRSERVRRQEAFLKKRVMEDQRKRMGERNLGTGGDQNPYGISQKDLDMFGFDKLEELSKAVIVLNGVRGAEGKTVVNLKDSYNCELEFIDIREPYIVVRGRLTEKSAEAGGVEKILLENTFYLEKSKPAVIGLTNLREALILVLRLREPATADAGRPAATP